MNHLFVSLLNPFSGQHKGDYKLLKQRSLMLQNHGHIVATTYFKINTFTLSASVHKLPLLPNQSNIIIVNIPLFAFLSSLPLIIIRHIIERKSIQTLLSRVLSHLSQDLLDSLFHGFDSIHFFHIRTNYFYLSSRTTHQAIYELIDSYALNLSRRSVLATSNIFRLLYKYESDAIQSDEYQIINHPKQPTVIFVSHLDAEHYSLGSVRSPLSIPLYTPIHAYRSSRYSPGLPIKVGFFGNLNYHPNIYAVKSLLELGRLNLSLTSPLPIRFFIGGRFPSRQLKHELLSSSSDFSLTSPIPSIPDFLDEIDVCIFFMRAGSGMQSKLLEAASNSCPMITTQQPYDAIFTNHRHNTASRAALVAYDISQVYQYLFNIYTGGILLDELTSSAHSFIQDHYSADAVTKLYLSSLPQ